ncbi:hypothetical protein TNCV_1724531 [Trichonephila clavipes]|nr:hypothetical protein TNCV_1724531 [Trichonephila clavipes]
MPHCAGQDFPLRRTLCGSVRCHGAAANCGDGLTDTNNAFSQSSEDFHVKNSILGSSGWYELLVDDSMSIKKANEILLWLDLLICALLRRGEEGMCHFELCQLLSRW